MMEQPSALAHVPQLVGSVDVCMEETALTRSRCWLDLEFSTFGVQIPGDVGSALDHEKLRFRNLVFPSQLGELTADEVDFTYVRSSPTFGGASADDTTIGRALDMVKLEPIWTFICNKPIVLKTLRCGHEVFFRPARKSYLSVKLACGGRLVGSKFGICIADSPDFGAANHTSLELALGCSLSECARLEETTLQLRLNEWRSAGAARPFYDASNDGFLDIRKDEAAIAEIYRAALEFQNTQPDGGRAFQFALEAFLECRTRSTGYVLRLLATMHMLEWLDGEATLSIKSLTEGLRIPSEAAKPIMILRNEVSHNHHSLSKRTDLLTAVEKAVAEIDQHVDLESIGGVSGSAGLLNYLISLTGHALLKRIGADVEPVNFIPGYGRFKH
ncbi:MAG: hypothetical protein WD046_04465 [Paracoccaceae bacterium]